jgi:hypothetical protein
MLTSVSPLTPAFPLRAFGVATAWTLGALPILLGVARCPVARLLHASCPGCGMTRAIYLLLDAQWARSFHMHPLALPSLLASLAIMAATTWVTFRRGTPVALLKEPLGRFASLFFVGVQSAVLILWIARLFGAFGGPVPV